MGGNVVRGCMTGLESGTLLGTGIVRHARLRPVRNSFAYPTYFLLLAMRRWRAQPAASALPRNRFGLISFHDRDHGDGGSDSLAWLDALLAREGIHDADGEAWLQCYPRVLGHTFKPVSFWYCHRADDSLAAIVVEVNNTFGERHCYLLAGTELGWGRELRVAKAFHVSPFCRIAGGYRFRFMRTGSRIVARIDHDDDSGPLLQTSLQGELAEITPRRLRGVFFGMPLMTLGVIGRIHWQALKLWLRRLPFHGKPAPPDAFTTR